eukprot:3503755-Lingulodinium_polyedra.AAC.1
MHLPCLSVCYWPAPIWLRCLLTSSRACLSALGSQHVGALVTRPGQSAMNLDLGLVTSADHFCQDCFMWVPCEQWDGHVVGKKHRKNCRSASLRQFSSDQRFVAREAA